MKRRNVIEQAKKKTEAEVRPLFVGYFDESSRLNLEEMTLDERIKKFEESKNIKPWQSKTKEEIKKAKVDKMAAEADGGMVTSEVKLQKKGRKKKRGNYKNH